MRVFASSFKFVVIVGTLAGSGQHVAAQETGNSSKYYMAVFAFQTDPNLPESTHTFATFVKAGGTAPSSAKARPIESHTISWMPATLDVRLIRLKPEPGINLDLPSSLRLAKSSNAKVSMWGPFEIKKELYDRAVAQVARLKKSGVSYKAIDRRYRGGEAFNCIHAVSDIDADAGYLDTGTASGEPASQLVVNHLRRWIIDPEKVHDSIGKELGLAEDAINRRGIDKEVVKP